MKKKSTLPSAFLNPRVLFGLAVVMTGVFLALAGRGLLSAPAANIAKALGKYQIITSSSDPLVPVGFDCSTIHEKGIDKQENMRAGAIMIACGQTTGGSSSATTATSTLGPVGRLFQRLLAPLAYGAGDVDLVTGTETSPNVTQSETYTLASPDNPNQIVVAYNDSRGRNVSPINISGASVSTDGGTTFTRLALGSGQGPFSNTIGDPVVLYHKPTGTWFTVWLDGACGGQGLGGYKSTTPENAASWTHFPCVHSNSQDDRESGWSDNNPASPFYGRMYVSWNDFNVGGGALFVTYSTDAGTTWASPVVVSNTGTFVRDVQITGDLSGNGVVYIAGMDEGGGGFPHNNINKIFKSTNGGASWTNTYTGPAFPGPGVTAVGYFACMFSDGGGYWRHEGWGEPAAYNNVVHLVYAQQGAGGDAGDVYYIRSTDGGANFGAPFKLNSDATTRPQWEPNISVSSTGTLLATWYDGRESASCTRGDTASPCYRMWSRKSNDNGATWLPDDAFSDVVTPLPAQPDPGIQATYAGDYDYGSATVAKHVTSWADGRVAIGGQSQQDAFTDRELVGFAVTTTTPACNSIINTQPVNFIINLSDAVVPGTVQATDFTVNGTPANSFVLSNGNARITFHFNSSPVVTQGVQTMHIPANAFNRASDNQGNFEFQCSFCYAITPLQVTTTVPAVGGTFSSPAPGDYQYDVNFNQAVDPGSVQTSDLTLTGNAGGSVTNVQLVNGNTTARFTVHFNFGGSVTASIGPGVITAAGCNGNAAFTGNYTVAGCPPQDHYNIAQIGGSIVPGTTDTGNHCDDCVTTIALPFSYSLYDQIYNAITVSSNGNAQLTVLDAAYSNICLPWTTHDYTILPYWDDLYTLNTGFGIFTSVTGTAPNRIFNIEWRAQYYPGTGTASFELRLYEGQTRFDVIYGTLTNGNTLATAGVQKNDTTFDQYFCNGSGSAATGGQSYTLQVCTPSPTPTATATPTPTATVQPSPTPTPTVEITVQTNPTGRTFTVDGATYNSTQTFSWTRGSSHTIGTTSPQNGNTGVRYVWTRWSDGGAISHTVAPATNQTYTANFTTQYYLTMSHGSGGTVTPTSEWRNSGATVSISATAASGYSFSNWTGTGTGSYSGTNNPASITMNGPITESAAFTQNVQVTVQTNPAGLSFSVDGTSYSSAQTFSWQPGSSHTIATTSPQNGATGVRYVWTRWSDGGAISHTVAPTTNKTYTANFNTQYFLTMNHGVGGSVSPTSGWKASGSTVSIRATPATGYHFTSWSGSGIGSYTGTNNPASIRMDGPISEIATFTHN